MNLPGYTLTSVTYENPSVVVLRGRRDADNARVLVKVPRGEPPTAREIAALWHEHGVLGALDVPGVVKAYALERHGGGVALVLEDPGRPTLAEILRRGRHSVEEVLGVAVAIAGILERVHLRGIIHKDLTPDNIVVHRHTGEVRLTGFGIATRLSQETQRALSPEALEGTLAYMSPEQTGRMNREIDHRTDFYSFGVTLYEALTGALPFAATEPMELVHCHIARVPTPPRERAPLVPEAVSRLVMKLLAKNAEDRYQSAAGLRVDLEACLAEVRSGAAAAPLRLGAHDRSHTLRIPQKLFGRAAEEGALLDAFARAGAGAAELLLVSGPAGIGKSALVSELHKAVARGGGRLVAGKFDQLGRSVPYAPIVQAFRELTQQILSEPADRLARWQGALAGAAEAGGKLLVELIPELERVIGPQPPAPALGPAESQNRFNEALTRLVGAFAGPGQPLALFLDDLQWADPASLKLLEVLLTDPARTHLLVIGAYRDAEVDASHPLEITLAALRQRGARIGAVALAPLALSDVIGLLTDTLLCPEWQAAPLARVVIEQTRSNPFYVRQFLEALDAEGLLRQGAGAEAWTWDLDAIRSHPATENVLELVARRVARLSAPIRRVLELAACIGHEFDLRTLSAIAEQPLVSTAAALWEALRDRLIVPVSGDYRLVHAPWGGDADAPETSGGLDVRYRFLHDRVQQAVYGAVEEARRAELHLRIGRLMLARAKGDAREEALFDIVTHLDLGAALMRGNDERAEAAALCLSAARKARAAAAYEAAAGYLRSGIARLPAEAWGERHELALALHRELAEAEYLSGRFEEADRLYPVALGHARTAMDRVSVLFVQATQRQLEGRHMVAIALQRAGLEVLGWAVPEGAEAIAATLAAELTAVGVHLGARSIEELVHAPRMERPEHRAMLELLQGMLYAAYVIGDQPLANLALVKMTTLSLEHGTSELSPFGYIGYGMIAGPLLSDYRTAHRFARMGIELSEQFDSAGMKCKANFLFAADVHSWTQPIKAADAYYDRAYALGLESGDWLTTGYMIIQSGSDRLTRGMQLDQLHRTCQAHLAFLRRARNQDAIDLLTAGVIQPILDLQGRTDRPGSFDGPGFSEATYLDRHRDLPYHLAWLHYAKIRSAYLFDDRARWPELVGQLDVVERAVPTHAKVPETTFYVALIRLASLAAAGEEERRVHLAELERLQSRLTLWAEACPANILHKRLLVQAEEARVTGRALEAMGLYEQAIAAAAEAGYTNNEALGNELYGELWVALGRAEVAPLYLRRALDLYDRWGATAKARHVEARHAALLAAAAPMPPPAAHATRGAPAGLTVSGLVDLTTVLRAGEALSGEIELDRVLDRVMRIVLSSAGGSRGFLLLAEGDELVVGARMSVDPDVVEVGPAGTLEGRDDLAVTVARHVMRTRETLVLDAATSDPRFAADPYLAAGRPRSILSLPLLHRGRLTGVLYLENHLTDGAFGPDRLELVKHLASQTAVAVENALLYGRVQRVSEELRRANEGLEQEVRARTEELRLANTRLIHELSEGERAEAARAALQEEVIRMQQAQLDELSTPLIPISAEVVVMPLIGTMDARRAAHVLEVALEGATRTRARAVILDVTGVRRFDAEVAGALVRAASALRLLGAEAILTGVRADMAQALLELGLDLGGLSIRGTLQSGIAHATRADRAPRRRQARS